MTGTHPIRSHYFSILFIFSSLVCKLEANDCKFSYGRYVFLFFILFFLKKLNLVYRTNIMQSKVWPLKTTVYPKVIDMLADAVDVLIWIINHYFLIPWREHSGQATAKMSNMTSSMRHMSS